MAFLEHNNLTEKCATLWRLAGVTLLSGIICSSALALESSDEGVHVQRLQLSERDRELLKNIDAQEKFMTLLDSPGMLSIKALNEIEFDTRKIAFYRFNDRQYRNFPRVFYDLIEQRMMDKFLKPKRFSVHECFECKTTRVLLKEKQFSILRQLDSNKNLADVGKKIGVDSFVLWEAYMYKGEPVLNVRVVSAKDGRVVWSMQYQNEPDYEYAWEFYSALWGLKTTRQSTGTAADISISPIIDLGVRTLTRSTITNRLYYGYGIEVFLNTADRDQINLFGLALSAKLALELDAMFGIERTNYGNWLIYGSLAQALVKSEPVIMSKAGLEVRMNRRSYVSIGGIFLFATDFGVNPLSGYENSAVLSGISYDITFGFRF